MNNIVLIVQYVHRSNLFFFPSVFGLDQSMGIGMYKETEEQTKFHFHRHGVA